MQALQDKPEADVAIRPVQVENVAKLFRQGSVTIHALSRVNLSVDRGEFVAVMGASGSGKSTLLHLLAGLTPPDEGRLVVDGCDLRTLSNRQLTLFRRRRVGLVFQAFNLIPSLTAEQNILLPLMADGSGDVSRQRLDELLGRLELGHRRHHRPDALSGGEQQRVAIARALMSDPALVLADEPTGSVDSVTGQKICRLLRDLCREQRRTIVLVTHEPAVAIWAQRVVVLKDGTNLAEFPTGQFADPQLLAAHYQQIVGTGSVQEPRA